MEGVKKTIIHSVLQSNFNALHDPILLLLFSQPNEKQSSADEMIHQTARERQWGEKMTAVSFSNELWSS